MTKAERTQAGVDCTTPQTDLLPQNPPGKGIFNLIRNCMKNLPGSNRKFNSFA